MPLARNGTVHSPSYYEKQSQVQAAILWFHHGSAVKEKFMSLKPSNEQIIVFDVNETLLDIEALHPFFANTFGHAQVMRQWFSELILYSQAISTSGAYVEFGTLAVAVLKMIAQIRHVSLSASDIDHFAQVMRNLPPHPEVHEALERLAAAGFRLVTLTNSPPQASREALDKAGLSHYFERQFSVDDVKQYKPARQTYDQVASKLGVEAGRLRLVAAHTWDTLGAMAAGCRAALVTRPGNAVLLVGAQPDIIGADLLEVADQIILKQTAIA